MKYWTPLCWPFHWGDHSRGGLALVIAGVQVSLSPCLCWFTASTRLICVRHSRHSVIQDSTPKSKYPYSIISFGHANLHVFLLFATLLRTVKPEHSLHYIVSCTKLLCYFLIICRFYICYCVRRNKILLLLWYVIQEVICRDTISLQYYLESDPWHMSRSISER